MPTDPKDVLKNYLQGARDTLIWKVDGLSERDLRLPRTATGMNLLGIVKHALHTEVHYFGPTFGREWPTPRDLVPAESTDSQAGWYATSRESAVGLVDLYRRVQASPRSGNVHTPAAERLSMPRVVRDSADVRTCRYDRPPRPGNGIR